MQIKEAIKLRYRRRLAHLRARVKGREMRVVADRTRAMPKDAIILLCTLRNERVRLPFFLRYYRDLGVEHFFFVDNDSTDGSREFLAPQPDVSLWTTKGSYKRSHFGVDWMAHLQRRFCHDHWCLTVDVDEFFVYPFCETRPLRALTDWLDASAVRSFSAMMLDMYPKGSITAQPYHEGQNPFEIAQWFDAGNYTIHRNPAMGNLWIQGGPRARVFFPDRPEMAPALNKVPLVRWQRSYAYVSSTHMILPRGLNLVYDERGGEKASGCLLHAKFLDTFAEKAGEEMARGQHYGASKEYRAYHEKLAKHPDMWCKYSEKYINWRQLEILGLMSKGELGMTVGFVMLCHTALERAAEVARHWAERDCPVVIHVDRRVAKLSYDGLVQSLSYLPNVLFSPRFACEWGTWGIVAATQEASSLMLRAFAQVRHVYLASGSCLPLRPVAELRAYLDSRPRTDFIESVTTADVGWTVGGLNLERFTLRFPFSWRSQRKAFDWYVSFQRKVGFRRPIPEGITPHLGSQWWCLTRQTLSAILENPDRGAIDRYFRRVWIPDESYFQTMVRKFSTQVESRSLTLAKFDYQGKPHIFYDDHLQLLRRSDCFVARKIWPQADKLYDTFLRSNSHGQATAEPNPGKIDRLFSKAVERRTKGRAGLYMHSRYPNENWENGRTAAPYSVFQGFSEAFENFESWLGKVAGTRAHGHLFAPDRVEFAGGEQVFSGGLPDSAKLRDYAPKNFLSNLIWNTRGERQCFQFGPGDNQDVTWFMACDPNAQISVITGAWAIPLFHSNQNFSDIRREAARLQKIESDHVAILRSHFAKARIRIWTLAEFVENPMEPLQSIIDEISPRSQRRLTEAPRLADLKGFGQFLQNLRNQGMQPVLMGDFPTGEDPTPAANRRGRPYLVK